MKTQDWTEIDEQPELESPQVSDAESMRRQIVAALLDLLGLSDWVTYSKVMNQVLFVLFIVSIGIFHVYNTHRAEGMTRETVKLEKEIKELRWEYTSIKSELMMKSKLSDIEAAVAEHGLYSPPVPPMKIVVKKNEN